MSNKSWIEQDMKNYINGFKNRRIEVLHFGSNNSDDMFIHFPGKGYGPNHPFFYYLIQFLESIKIDQIFFNYKWSEQEEIFKLPQDEGLGILKSEIDGAINYIETQLSNKILHIVGKSFGTVALQLIHENEVIKKNRISSFFWLTPFINTKDLTKLSFTSLINDFFYVGSKDMYYIESVYKTLKNSNKVRILNNLNHSFEQDENVVKSISGLKTAIELICEDIKTQIHIL